ncbi:MAG: 1-deoxy-D-xylulose-5-phosphate reductoisomerase [Gammaproteobacteria bacterium]|nr:1-deoxy-D-xylulose-5-phosphate reductoisomerase [Gammaproteobacteria bacterium]
MGSKPAISKQEPERGQERGPGSPQTGVTILGATGSIGINTLDVISRYPNRYRVVALTGYSQVERMMQLCKAHRPDYVVMVDADAAELLSSALSQTGLEIEVSSGASGLEKVASLPQVSCVMAAIVGAAGLIPTLAAAKAGKRVLLANKEALVMSGPIFMNAVRENNATLLPIDSEHNAIFQCMPQKIHSGDTQSGGTQSGDKSVNASHNVTHSLSGRSFSEMGIRRILLTASGGPFRKTPLDELYDITPEQACAHPVWSMGKKISVDSATMMNKGLEVIEACWLFNTNANAIQVVIHPQSVIHSMVEYVDGSLLAQLGNPDMRTPIAYALAWPERIDSGVARLDIFDVARLEFEKPDLARFPCLGLAIAASKAGGTAPAILNAANEVAVSAFLAKRLPFIDIARVVERTLESITFTEVDNLETVLQVDEQARTVAEERIKTMSMRVH